MNDYGPKRFKRWGPSSPVGESQFQALDNVDAPFLTSIGPGYEARKKGQFRELIVKSSEEVVAANFRASELLSSGIDFTDGTFPPDGSLRFRTKEKDISRTDRTDQQYFPTVDWVSQDKKYRVSWLAQSRYPKSFEQIPSGTLPLRPQYFTGILTNYGWAGWKVLGDVPFTRTFWVNGRAYTAPGCVLGACVAVRNEGGTDVPYVVIVSREIIPNAPFRTPTSVAVDTVPDQIFEAELTGGSLSFTSRPIPRAQFNTFTNGVYYLYRERLTCWHFNADGTQAVTCQPGSRAYSVLDVPPAGSVSVQTFELSQSITSSDSLPADSVVSLPATRTVAFDATSELIYAADYTGATLTLLTRRTIVASAETNVWALLEFTPSPGSTTSGSWSCMQSSSRSATTTQEVRLGGVLRDTVVAPDNYSGEFPFGLAGPDSGPVVEIGDVDFVVAGLADVFSTDRTTDDLVPIGVDLRVGLFVVGFIRDVNNSSGTRAGTTDTTSISGGITVSRTDKLFRNSQLLKLRTFARGTYNFILGSNAVVQIPGYDSRDTSQLQVSGAWDHKLGVGLISLYSDKQDFSFPLDAREGEALWVKEVDGVTTVTELSNYAGKVLHGVCAVSSASEGRP